MRYEEEMETPGESPLDVLSRAASMVQGREIEELRRRAAQRPLAGGGGAAGQHSAPSQDRRSPAKDLPTRQRKLERSESRRNDPLTAPKLRVKRQDSAAYSDAGDDAGADTPLDMSVGRRGSPPPYRGAAPSPPGQFARPSVITCGPGRSDSEDGAGSDGDLRPDDLRTRGEVIKDFPGVCDPVIDEHFRRSLGKHYASLFKSSAPAPPQQERQEDCAGMSVDDHFAKALGDTWVKLKEQDQAAEQVASVPLIL